MKHLYVLMPWPEDIVMLWIKFLSFISVFCSTNLSCSMIVHIDKKEAGGHKFSELACFILQGISVPYLESGLCGLGLVLDS